MRLNYFTTPSGVAFKNMEEKFSSYYSLEQVSSNNLHEAIIVEGEGEVSINLIKMFYQTGSSPENSFWEKLKSKYHLLSVIEASKDSNVINSYVIDLATEDLLIKEDYVCFGNFLKELDIISESDLYKALVPKESKKILEIPIFQRKNFTPKYRTV